MTRMFQWSRHVPGLVTLLAVSGVLAVAPARAADGCIGSGTDADINSVLTGVGAAAILCPGAVFDLQDSVRFTATNQHIYTLGLPTDGSRALLRIASADITTAVWGVDQSGVIVENIQADGSRPQFGIKSGSALIEMGGHAANQTVRGVAGRNTRSWSTISLFGGAAANNDWSCQQAWVLNNEVGPAGNDDGTIADGISLACGNSVVQGNVIRDATDGGIVAFGAAGSLIQSNTIVAETKELLGGINMVDYNPVNGNYQGTRVTDNVIDAHGAFIRVAIPIGSRVWGFCDPPDHYNVGGSVTNNWLRGLHMGYGIAVAGASGFTITGNVDQSRHVGVAAQGCGGAPAPPRSGYLYHPGLTSNTTLQGGFLVGNVSDRLFHTSEPPILRVPLLPSSTCGELHGGQGVYLNQLLSSCDGRFQLIMQGDGNLVLNQPGVGPLWATNTAGQWVAEAFMQADGNFALYSGDGHAWFNTGGGHPGARLVVRNDGNLMLYDAAGSPLWSSGTCCH